MNNSLYVYTNGIRCLSELPKEYDKNKIVFVGNMRTLQNQDAVQFFVTNIFPLVKVALPQVVFHIIGAEPPTHIEKMCDNKNIIVSGFVPSVENAIKDAAVAIAAGIQNKVLIAMACGVPVVLTSLVSTGIPELVPGRNCIIADEKADFANVVVYLMQDENMRNRIGKAGYDMVKSEYSWNKRLDGYEQLDTTSSP